MEIVMKRASIGAGVGMVCGVLTLAGFGAWVGFGQGVGTRIPPGWEGAGMGAFIFTAYYWWLAGTIGGVIGGLAGVGSWLVRPRPPTQSSAFNHQ